MTDDQVLFGWNPDLDIPSAIQLAANDLVNREHVLISMVDSTPRVAELPSLSPLLTELGAAYHAVDSDISVTLETLLMLIDSGFFNGFDEMWLFREPPSISKPPSLRLTSDAPLGTESPDQLTAWMTEAGCFAGLGDGTGLNFVTFDPVLAKLWQANVDI